MFNWIRNLFLKKNDSCIDLADMQAGPGTVHWVLDTDKHPNSDPAHKMIHVVEKDKEYWIRLTPNALQRAKAMADKNPEDQPYKLKD